MKKEKKGFFSPSFAGITINPWFSFVLGIILSFLFRGSLLGSIGAILSLTGFITLIKRAIKRRTNDRN